MAKYTEPEISEFILQDFEEKMTEAGSDDETLRRLELLVNSKIAIKISGHGYTVGEPGEVEKMNCICKFMLKYNKSLKKYISKGEDYESGEREYADDNPKLIKLAKCKFMPGTYYAMLDNHDYAVFKVSKDPKYIYRMPYDFYIIGKKCEKNKDKFFKLYEKYKKIAKDTTQEQVIWTAKSGYKNVKFKPFDKCIIRNKDKIIQEIENWKANIPQYHNYGMIPKLSILLYGKPGTGKSTFYQALADYLKIETVNCLSPDYFINSDGFDDDDDDYPRRRLARRGGGGGGGKPSENSIWAIDDIDCVCQSREEDKSQKNNATMANLLTFLDNPDTFYLKANDGKYYLVSIVVATTNYYEKLDEAVKRHGRFDMKIEMEYFNKEEAQQMCDLYDLKLSDVLPGRDFDDKFTILPAELQAECLKKVDSNIKGKKK